MKIGYSVFVALAVLAVSLAVASFSPAGFPAYATKMNGKPGGCRPGGDMLCGYKMKKGPKQNSSASH